MAEVQRLVGGDKTRPLILYCNGPFCGKSKRLSEELLAAGFTSVRRYQLGIPVWRALVGLTEIEMDAVQQVFQKDRTAVFLDARGSDEFGAGSLPGARSIPQGSVQPGKDVGEVRKAKDDGRLPMEDHNTRIVVFGRDAAQARALAEAIAQGGLPQRLVLLRDVRRAAVGGEVGMNRRASSAGSAPLAAGSDRDRRCCR